MLQRPFAAVIEPCLPSTADHPPSGPDWVHEIKHDGYRLMARRDPIAISARLLTRNGHDWASRYSLIVEAVQGAQGASCLIDGEAVACDENGKGRIRSITREAYRPARLPVRLLLARVESPR
ncbi:MAG TPA: hypothetical protein VH397_04365 [Xanthobacteraceae bacterium]|jgi:ATP-dependent DNA ligase